MSRRGLEERLAAVEARQRAYEMHDLGCPAFVPTNQQSGFLGSFALGSLKDQCVCWLADPATICQECGHRWAGHIDGHCFAGATITGPPAGGIYNYKLACLCKVAPS